MYPNYNYNDPYENGYAGSTPAATLSATVNSTMKRVYLKMTLALIVTAFIALFCASSVAYRTFLAGNSWLMWVLVFGELGIVFGISGAINRMSNTASTLLFYLFAVINGMMLSTIFLAFHTLAIAKTFFITAGTFGAMSVYGYCTNRDLSRIGSILTMALIGLVLAMVVNIFLGSNSLDWVISLAGVFIFVGLTAWDTQKVKTLAAMAPAESAGRLATIGALTLYLDFINLFLFLLRFFGGNRD